ncbi:FAD-dependent monooxygenase [Roseibium sediminis]|uniref:FAD-dependent monooxygenase n=1 Tax=Roseibium sediminis TaxID=1775174 RepID=UPI00123D939A|nr:FAD-dependent monooxygenase [Roseibium sediminis]
MPEREKRSFPVVIAGAGIGGLTAALALNDAGYEVCVLEKASELREVGAGLQLSPNACSVLERLGVLDELLPHAVLPEGISIRSGHSGKLLGTVPLGGDIAERYGLPYLVIHRADLQATLFEHACSRKGIDIRLDAAVSDIKINDQGQITCLYETSDDVNAVGTRALIGADGVWSKVRRFVPGHNTPKFTGQAAYRATIPAEGLPSYVLNRTGLWLGPNAHVVHYPISGGSSLNIVVLIAENWTEQDWSAPADADMVHAALDGWSPELLSLIEKSPKWLKWALCGVDANGPWRHGQVALLGDAAHGMLPYAAQGGAMAIEDAFVLARTFKAQNGDANTAFAIYEAERKDRVARVQALARRNASIYHMGAPLALARDTVMRMMPPKKFIDQMDWIYRWTATASRST